MTCVIPIAVIVAFLLRVIMIVGGLIYFPMLIPGPGRGAIHRVRSMAHNGGQRPGDHAGSTATRDRPPDG